MPVCVTISHNPASSLRCVLVSHGARLNGVSGLGPVRVLTRKMHSKQRLKALKKKQQLCQPWAALFGVYRLPFYLLQVTVSLLSFTHSEQGAQHAGSTAWLLAKNEMSKTHSGGRCIVCEDRVQHQECGQGCLIKHLMLLSEYYTQGGWNPVEQESWLWR